VEEFGYPDLLIIPGSKNTIEDLLKLRECGLERRIKAYSETGLIIGICGGYQMLGKLIEDPYGVETDVKEVEAIGLLDIKTAFEKEKVTTRVNAESIENFNVYKDEISIENRKLKAYGYEIHMGICTYGKHAKPLFNILNKNGEKIELLDGAINSEGNIMGTYIHGVFDGVDFREFVLNKIRVKKGMKTEQAKVYESLREAELDKLADIVRQSLDMNKIYEIMNMKR